MEKLESVLQCCKQNHFLTKVKCDFYFLGVTSFFISQAPVEQLAPAQASPKRPIVAGQVPSTIPIHSPSHALSTMTQIPIIKWAARIQVQPVKILLSIW